VSRRLPWLIAGGAGVLLVAALVTGRARAGHPDPRRGITAEAVLPPAAVPRTAGSVESYAAARAVPQVLDGLHCYCDCARHSGHRSLLTCFESEHGGYCDICMGEAVLAQQLTARGEAIDAIRRAVDAQFGS
jgi:hypothetical protein